VADQITIPKRFCGPPESGNGGYVCGLLAGYVNGDAEVTLRLPPPLDRPLDVVRESGVARLMEGDKLVAEFVTKSWIFKYKTIEEVSVCVERCRNRGMAEPRLDHLGVFTYTDQQRSMRMAQVVETQRLAYRRRREIYEFEIQPQLISFFHEGVFHAE
jgi:hypothetical protein